MTEVAPAKRAAAGTPARRPRFLPTALASLACFAVAFEFLAFQLRAGNDPALGAGPVVAAKTARPSVIERRIVNRRVVHDPPAQQPTTATPSAAVPASSAAAPAVTPAPAATPAPAPAPAPAPTPAPVTSSS